MAAVISCVATFQAWTGAGEGEGQGERCGGPARHGSFRGWARPVYSVPRARQRGL
jgi:hypothetical protein